MDAITNRTSTHFDGHLRAVVRDLAFLRSTIGSLPDAAVLTRDEVAAMEQARFEALDLITKINNALDRTTHA